MNFVTLKLLTQMLSIVNTKIFLHFFEHQYF